MYPPVVAETKAGDASISLEHVSIWTPDLTRLLVKDLNFHCKRGESVMISGPNGCGKTSMFRVIAGLWPLQSGTLRRPKGYASQAGQLDGATQSSIFYIPQNPYLVSGTLLEQVIYPMTIKEAVVHVASSASAIATASAIASASASDDGVEAVENAVMSALENVGLQKFLKKGRLELYKRHHDWSDVLSGGEKQRVGLSRLFFHKPAFAVLDESTSAMNESDEGPLYQRILDLGVTVFSIAHRLQLRRFHTHQLWLVGDGTGAWTMDKLAPQQ
jgi:ATP-binding cassette subfamily D (ALD) protein 3